MYFQNNLDIFALLVKIVKNMCVDDIIWNNNRKWVIKALYGLENEWVDKLPTDDEKAR